jgi:hypothetical protein
MDRVSLAYLRKSSAYYAKEIRRRERDDGVTMYDNSMRGNKSYSCGQATRRVEVGVYLFVAFDYETYHRNKNRLVLQSIQRQLTLSLTSRKQLIPHQRKDVLQLAIAVRQTHSHQATANMYNSLSYIYLFAFSIHRSIRSLRLSALYFSISNHSFIYQAIQIYPQHTKLHPLSQHAMCFILLATCTLCTWPLHIRYARCTHASQHSLDPTACPHRMKRRREGSGKMCGKCDDARRGSLSFGPSSNVVQQRRKSLARGGEE